jgi:hypothetical protein
MLVSVHLETLLIMTQYRCSVCAERTIGLENVLDAADGTPYGLLFWSVWRQL